MQTLNNADLAFLSILGDRALLTQTLQMYSEKTYLFTENSAPHLCVMWDALTGLLRDMKRKSSSMSKDIVAAALADAVQADRDLTEELRSKCDRILKRYLDGKFPPSDEGRRYVANLINLETHRRIINRVSFNADLEELRRTIDTSLQRVNDLKEQDEDDDDELGIMFNPLKEIRKLTPNVERVPTGINWLDEVSGGGGRGGDKWLILGAPGGGKTVMAVQFACAQSLLGNYTLWATYEQSLEGDIAERMIANITDTSLDLIRDVGFDNLQSDIREKYWSAVTGAEEYLTALDMTKAKQDPGDENDYGGIYSVRKYFNMLKERGVKPKTVIIDWFGAMLNRVATNKGIDLSAAYRFAAQREITELIKFAKEENILIIMFHQLNTEAVNARPTHLANASQAQDMKSLQNYFDAVFPIGIRDENGVCYFSGAKSRKAGKVVRTLRLIGDRSKFVMEAGWLPNKDGQFYRPLEDGADEDLSKMAASYSREI